VTACHLDHDPEWQQRIAHHRQRRPADWQTLEAPYQLAEAIDAASQRNHLLLVDCLTVWLSNIMLADHNIEQEQHYLCRTIEATPASILLISNETGMGVVPDHPLGRRFRDAQGRLNQRLAAICHRVDLIVAGLPLRLKG